MSMFCKNKYLTIFFYYLILKIVGSSPVSYDQRQTGDLNFQLDVKNVQVVALVNKDVLDDYVV